MADPTYIVELANRPGVQFEVSQAEYERLRDLGFLLNEPANPVPANYFQTEVLAVVSGAIDTVKNRANHTGTQTLDTTTDTGNRVAMTPAERTKLTGIATSATANSTDVALRDRSTHTGTQTLDTTTDTGTRVAMIPAERTKLTGIATAATANATDASLRDRATHTGSQTSATISDLTEAVQDIVGAFFGATAGQVTYNDAANTITITAGSGSGDPELMRDTIGAALLGVGNIAVTVNDVADTITISTSATVNSTDAALRDRSTHTGTQAISTVVNLQSTLDAKATTVDVGDPTTNFQTIFESGLL